MLLAVLWSSSLLKTNSSCLSLLDLLFEHLSPPLHLYSVMHRKGMKTILNRFHTSISVSHRRNGMKCPLWHFEWYTVARKCPESFVSTWNLRMWPYLEAESLPRQGLRPCSDRIVRIDPKANDSVLARKRKQLQRCSVRGHTETKARLLLAHQKQSTAQTGKRRSGTWREFVALLTP